MSTELKSVHGRVLVAAAALLTKVAILPDNTIPIALPETWWIFQLSSLEEKVCRVTLSLLIGL